MTEKLSRLLEKKQLTSAGPRLHASKIRKIIKPMDNKSFENPNQASLCEAFHHHFTLYCY